MPNLAQRLTQLQTQKSLLKKDIAQAVGISIMAYYRYEKGERMPDGNTLIALADYFNVSLDYLVGRSDNPKINE